MGKEEEFDTESIEKIIINYEQMEKSLVSQLFFKHEHGPSIGGFREEIWKELFEQIVPRKFAVEQSVFLIDSEGRVSNEVDLAIFDEIYTPYIFRKGKLKFIPIEAVAIAVECKSTSADKENLEDWKNSIGKLRTSRRGIARMHTSIVTEESEPKTQSATRPLLIYCYLGKENKSNHDYFDFAIRADENNSKFVVYVQNEEHNLFTWFNSLNHHIRTNANTTKCMVNDGNEGSNEKRTEGKIETKISMRDFEVKYNGENVSLLSLKFQINQLLMLINNPMLFPHLAYVEMFNRISKEKE